MAGVRRREWVGGGRRRRGRHDPRPLPSHMLRFSRCEFLASYRGKVAIYPANRTSIFLIRLPSDSGRVHH
nr:MAG TPA: hypothetical protein [Caudoviricetes sp.]